MFLIKKIVMGLPLLIIFCYSSVFGQQPQEYKRLVVGSFQSWYSNFGIEIESGGPTGNQLDGLQWDAQFPFQDVQAAKGIWIGTTNFFDKFLNTTVPYKVVGGGPRRNANNQVSDMVPVEFKMVGRFIAPTVIVDGFSATDNKLRDIVDEIDPALKADRMIVNTLHTSIGLTVTRKIMAFSQQYNDNYFIHEYTFKNTGIYNANGDILPNYTTLTDVVIFFMYRYGFGWESFSICPNSDCGWAPSNNITWGRNAINHQFGFNPNDPSFEMRAMYSWYGKHSATGQNSLGCPWLGGDGHLGAPQFVGTATLHCDISPQNFADNLLQPATTLVVGQDLGPVAMNQFNIGLNTDKYETMISGHESPTHAEKIIGNRPIKDYGANKGDFSNLFGADNGGFGPGAGYGPFTLAPGDSIHVVFAEGMDGVSRLKSFEIGKNYLAGVNGQTISDTLPNGSTPTDPDVYKDSWVMSGVDSILQTFRRAIQNYNSGYNIPQPPPPPDIFQVESGGDRIRLTWSNNAESWPNFAGYQIYRAVTTPDTFFTMIADVPAGVNTFDDVTARRGFEYYYYVQSYDNGSINNIQPGVPLVSSKFYTMTNTPAYLRRPAKTSFSEIRIVPNPVDIRSNPLGDKVAFYGLPPKCTIRIFTERGDLIQTIEHTNTTGDELWNLLTSSSQIPVSGVYIVHIEATEDVVDPETNAITLQKGESAIKKFIIIR